MIGKIKKIGTNAYGYPYAFIKAEKSSYYFDERNTCGVPLSDFFEGDYVEFDPFEGQRGFAADNVRLLEILEGKLTRFFVEKCFGYINNKLFVHRDNIINYNEYTIDTDTYEYSVSFWAIPDPKRPNMQCAVGVEIIEQIEKPKLDDLIVPPLDKAIAEKIGLHLQARFPNKKTISLSVLRDVLKEIGESPELHGFDNMTLFCKALPSIMSLHEFEEGQGMQIYAILHDTIIQSNTYNKTEESNDVEYDSKIEKALVVDNSAKPHAENSKYFDAGFARYFNKERAYEKCLKPNSGEEDVLEKLSEILYISRVNYHETYQYCIAGATNILKQFISGRYEFLIVFSHFSAGNWHSQTLQVEKEIRKRKDVSDRSPLVNFYLLISNARTLREEVDARKGGSTSAIIPFTFDEILACSDGEELKKLVISRFSDYYFENNMLGETSAIDDDSLLFGDRGKIADAIAFRCQSTSYSGIFGLRRSGKTSVLNAVFRRLERNNIKYIKIQSGADLEHLDSWKTALFDIAKKIRATTLDLEQQPGESRQEYAKKLSLNSTEEDYTKRASQYFVEDVKLYCRDEKIFVIAIDEIERITYNTTSSKSWKSAEAYCGFWNALRDCGCAIIVCGVNSTIDEVHTVSLDGMSSDNPMYGRIQKSIGSATTYLPIFTDEQTKYMINTLGSYSGIAFTNVYQIINRAFGGQPFAIRQFCSYVYEKVKKHREPGVIYEVSIPAVERLLDEFSKSHEGLNLCDVILQHIKIYPNEYAMLCNIATAPEQFTKMSLEQIKSVDHLVKYGLIDWDPSTNYLAFRIQIVQQFICSNISKDLRLMSNDERRRYVQDNVAKCEKQFKRYILNYYLYSSNGEAQCRSYFSKYILDNESPQNKIRKSNPPIDPATCDLLDFFDHKKLVLYFSKVGSIIRTFWGTLGEGFRSVGITKEMFITIMNDLNAGRTDADHYDAEDLSSYPKKWEIDDETIQAFSVALKKLQPFFDKFQL